MMMVRTKVGPSLIHGMGLFASDNIPRGTAIWRFEPGFDRAFKPEELASLPPQARGHVRWFSFVSQETGEAILSGDHACFMNHSSIPNTGADSNAVEQVTTIALRDIAAGEEITCNYLSFDADAARKLTVEPHEACPET
jgi:SET domain-containing protein